MEKSNNIDSHKKPNAGNTEGERNFYHLKFLNLRCLEISRHVLFGPPSAATNTTRLALIYKQIGASISRQNWSWNVVLIRHIFLLHKGFHKSHLKILNKDVPTPPPSPPKKENVFIFYHSSCYSDRITE